MGAKDHLEVNLGIPSPGNVPVYHPANNDQELRVSVLVLRCISLVLATVAAVLMGTTKQTKTLGIRLPGMAMTMFTTKTATFDQTKEFICFVAANAIVAIYSFLQSARALKVIITGASMRGSRPLAWITFVCDQALAYFLISACSAATEVAYIAKQGEVDVGWNQVCSMFSHFCNQVGISVVGGYFAFAVLALLSVVSANSLFSIPYTADKAITKC